MKGWVGLVGWPIADGLPTLVVTNQLQVERSTGKVRRPETDVLPLCHATKCDIICSKSSQHRYRKMKMRWRSDSTDSTISVEATDLWPSGFCVCIGHDHSPKTDSKGRRSACQGQRRKVCYEYLQLWNDFARPIGELCIWGTGGVLSTVDMVVQWRDGTRRLRDHDDRVDPVPD